MPPPLLTYAVELWATRPTTHPPAEVAAALRALAGHLHPPEDQCWIRDARAALDTLQATRLRHGPHHRHAVTATLTVAGHLTAPPVYPLAAVYYRAAAADSCGHHQHPAWAKLDMVTVLDALGVDDRARHTAATLVPSLAASHGHLHPLTIAAHLTEAQLTTQAPQPIDPAVLAYLRHVPNPLTRAALTGLSRIRHHAAATSCTWHCSASVGGAC